MRRYIDSAQRATEDVRACPAPHQTQPYSPINLKTMDSGNSRKSTNTDSNIKTLEVDLYRPTTGVTELDHAIAKHKKLIYLITLIAESGAGKTLMCVQMTVEAVKNGKDVLFISTEIQRGDLMLRFLSAYTEAPYEKISHGLKWNDIGGARIPCLDTYGPKLSAEFQKAINLLNKHVTFLDRTNSSKPEKDFAEILLELDQKKYNLMIFDWLQYNDGLKTSEIRLKVEAILRKLAEHRLVTTVLTCQAVIPKGKYQPSTKELPPFHAVECTDQGTHSDIKIAISAYTHSEEEERKDDCDDSYLNEQHFHVYEIQKSIPCCRDFDIQRFVDPPAPDTTSTDSAHDGNEKTTEDDGDWTDIPNPDEDIEEDDSEVGKESAEVKDKLKRNGSGIRSSIRVRKGFVKLQHRTLGKLFELSNPAAINVYTFLLLVAKHENSVSLKVGDSFVTRKQVSEGTGLTESQFRTALEHLKDAKLVTTRAKEKGRGLIYSICNYPTNKSKGYFKLYRNILEKPGLCKDSELLRVWIYILSRAARKMSEDYRVPGHVIIYNEEIKNRCQVSLEQFVTSLKKLKNSERVSYQPDEETLAYFHDTEEDFDVEEWHITIKNWRVYQGDNVYPIKQKKE